MGRLEELKKWLPLFVISSMSLFIEVAVIRWLSAEIRVLSYYKNLVLLAAFLGLSIGFALVGRGRDYRDMFAYVWAAFILLVMVFIAGNLHDAVFFPGKEDEAFWKTINLEYWPALLLFSVTILTFFISSMLLFGTTWFFNTLAISGVLVMALMANLFVLKSQRVNLRYAYALLAASMLVSFTFPLDSLGGSNAWVRGLVGTLLLSLPLLFSGIIFSEALRRMGETARPLTSNISGSAVGGLLEYGSLLWGIKSLYLFGMLVYAGALLAAYRGRLLGK